jgi:tetratricopeptide (TPR) repeat protein
MLVTRNGDPIRLLDGEILSLRPGDRLRIEEIFTNIAFNYGVRLFSSGLDANALLYEEMAVRNLLPEGEAFDPDRYPIEVKRGGTILGYVYLAVAPSVEDWLARADRIIDPEKRLELLNRALELHPGEERIRDRIIEESLALERWGRATDLLEGKAARNPKDEQILQKLLTAYETAGNPKGVLSALERLAALNPEDPVLGYRLAQKLEEAGRIEGALKEYERVLGLLEEDQDRAVLLETLGYLYSQTGNTRVAIERYAEALTYDPDDVNLYYNLASLHDQAGNPQKADEYLKKAVSMEAGDTDARLRLAQNAIERGEPQEAERYLKEVLDREPDSLEAMLMLADVLDRLGKRKELKALYRKILPHTPDNETLVYNLAVLEYETAEYAAAARHLEKYLRSKPGDVTARELLLDAYVKLEQWEKAYQTALALLDRAPKNMGYYRFIFDVLSRQERWDELVPLLKKGLRANPGNPTLTDYLILVYLETDRQAPAMDLMEEALEQRPRDVELMLRLAELADRQGETDRALRTYRRVLEIQPEQPEAREGAVRILLQRARRLEAAGDPKAAMATYEEIMEIAPGTEEAEEAYLRLRLETVGE